MGGRLTCVFVDHGLLREGEAELVEASFGQSGGLSFVRVDAKERFLNRLRGVTDPEAKRRAIGEEFVRVFEAEARKLGGPEYLVQGTIYPDVVESGSGEAAAIKSHHNVGGLPADMEFKGVVEPLRELFKDEVRALGRELGLPEALVDRQPFPGPGLAVRVVGEVTEEGACARSAGPTPSSGRRYPSSASGPTSILPFSPERAAWACAATRGVLGKFWPCVPSRPTTS